MVFWNAGEPPLPKILALTAGKDETVHITGVKLDDKLFEASVEMIEEGKRYAIRITPKNTSKAATSSVEIQTDWPVSEPRAIKALARVIPRSQAR
jgi:hypothetical protein